MTRRVSIVALGGTVEPGSSTEKALRPAASATEAAESPLAALRSVAHSPRRWPAPFGAAIDVIESPFADGLCSRPAAAAPLTLVRQRAFRFASAPPNPGRIAPAAA